MMTQQEQRIAIAEWYGFENIKEEKTGLWGWIDVMTAERLNLSPSYYQEAHDLAFCRVPNYTEDLNAMHEAGEKLSSQERYFYSVILHVLVYPDDKTDAGFFNVISARASQRSEALCRTLWPERFEK